MVRSTTVNYNKVRIFIAAHKTVTASVTGNTGCRYFRRKRKLHPF